MSGLVERDLDPSEQQLLEPARPRQRRRPSRRELAGHAAVALAFVAAAGALALLAPSEVELSLPVAAALTLCLAVAARIEFDVGAGYTVPTQLVFVPMLFLVPAPLVPLLVAVAFLAAAVPDLASGRTHPARALLAVGDSWFAIGPAVVLVATGADELSWSLWPLYALALGAQFACDFASASVREWLALGVRPALQLRPLAWVYAVDALLAPIGLLAAFASQGGRFAFLLVVPLCGLLWLFAQERHVRMQQALALSHAYRGTALLLGDLVEEDDAYTGDHSRGVVELALAVADELGLDARSRRDLEFAALLHDVGKVSIPKELLNKAASLTHEEMALMRTHTIEGARILSRFGGLLGDVGRTVRSCHERWDGGGYPDGLIAEEIPFAARIIFACDAFNAMTTDRPYRQAMAHEDAIAELRAHAGRQFDAEVVEVVVRLVGLPRKRARPPHPAGDEAVPQPVAS